MISNEVKTVSRQHLQVGEHHMAHLYLAFSSIVVAGLDGINRIIDPGEPVNENIYKMSNSRKSSLGIKSLPPSLEESLSALNKEINYLKMCFQIKLIELYIRLREEEIREIGRDKSKTRQFTYIMIYD